MDSHSPLYAVPPWHNYKPIPTMTPLTTEELDQLEEHLDTMKDCLMLKKDKSYEPNDPKRLGIDWMEAYILAMDLIKKAKQPLKL